MFTVLLIRFRYSYKDARYFRETVSEPLQPIYGVCFD